MVKEQTHAQVGVNEIVPLEFAYVAAICTVDMCAAVRDGLSGHTCFCCHL
jgi:hypothetical protein